MQIQIHKKILQNIFTFLLLLSFQKSYAPIDFLDTTFGPDANGIVKTIVGTNSQVNGLAIDSTGKIIAVGVTTITELSNIVVAKYNINGTLDTAFGTNGIVTTTSGASSSAGAVTVDSTNRILVGGINGSGNVLVVRYTTTGALDTTFGSGGFATQTIGEGSSTNAILIDANSKILVAGTTIINGQSHIFVARFNSNGTVDTTFNNPNGYVTLTGTSHYRGHALKLDLNAKILVGGNLTTANGTDFLIARFNTDGTVDTTFGTNGVTTATISTNTNDSIEGLTVDSSNRIIAGGYVLDTNGNGKFALARFNNSGVLDSTFGESSTGIVTTIIGAHAQAFDAVIDLDGKIVAGGISDNKFAVARYNTNGSLDTTFGIGGILATVVGAGDAINALAVQSSDGRVLAGGFTTDQTTEEQNIAVVRYNKNNTDFVNITSIVDNSTINTKIPVVSGTSNGTTSPQASVQILVNGTASATVNTDASGNWNAGSTRDFATPTILPIGTNTIQANLIINSVVVVSHVTKFTVVDNLSEDSLFAFNSTNQTKTTSTFTTLPFNNTPVLGTWTYATNVFTCNKSGRYLIEYVGHPGCTAIGAATAINVATMVTINGTEHVGSASNSNIDLLAVTTRTLSKVFVKDLVAGQTLSLNFGVTVVGVTSGSVPGLIVNTNSSGTQHAYALIITRIG